MILYVSVVSDALCGSFNALVQLWRVRSWATHMLVLALDSPRSKANQSDPHPGHPEGG